MKTALMPISGMSGFILPHLRVVFLCGVCCVAFLRPAPAPAQSVATALDPHQIKTVFLIPLENHDWTQACPTCNPQQIQGNPAAPYVNSLVTPGNANAVQVSYSTAYYMSARGGHPSEPNYIWSEAGTEFGVHTDNDPSVAHGNLFSTPNHLSRQLTDAGIVWKDYQEDLEYCPSAAISAAGQRPSGNNPYNGSKLFDRGVKHDPMQFFADTQNKNVYTLAQFFTDLNNNTVGRYNWITPNEYNEMHSALPSFTYHGVQYSGNQAAIAQGDNFLSIVVPKIMASAAYQDNGVIIIWTDETESTDDTGTTLPFIVISPLAKGNAYVSNVALSHSSTLKMMDEIFDLSFQTNEIVAASIDAQGTAYNYVDGRSATVNDLSDLFQGQQCLPVIVSQPASLTNYAGTSATFSVGATSCAALSYQWFFNGNSISKATNASLTLNNVQSSNAGNYTVRVTSQNKSVLSSIASLTVIMASTVKIVATDPFAAEVGLDPGTFTISRTGSTNGPLTVSFTISGSATPGSDYVALASPVTLSAGAVSTNLTVLPIDDFLTEGTETVIATLTAGSGYIIGSPSSATVIIVDDDNHAPSVAIINPADGAAFTGPVNIPIGASASDIDGTVTRVDFYFDATNSLGSATVAPYGITWNNPPGGTHLLTAVATDNLGATAVSAPVRIYVNSPPTISIVNPLNGADFVVPANLVITASAMDNGSVALVEFFIDGVLLGTKTTSPYTIAWTNVAIAQYVLTARATDNEGVSAWSLPVNISVHEPLPEFANDFAAQGRVTHYTNYVFGNNFPYTRESGEPRHAGAFGTNSGWISWIAPDSGLCTMTTTTNGMTGLSNLFDTVLAVYTGDAISNLTCVASNDDDPTVEGYTAQSRVSFPAVAGTTYHVAVDAYGAGQSGNIYFRMSLATSGPTITNAPQSQVVNAGENVTFTVGARSPTSLSYQWRWNGADVAGATNGSCVLINAQYTSAGNYSVMVANSLGSTISQSAELIVRPKIVAGTTLTNGAFRLTLNGTPGRQYAIESATTPLNWTLLDTVTHSAVQLEYIDTTAPSPNRFYRLRLVP